MELSINDPFLWFVLVVLGMISTSVGSQIFKIEKKGTTSGVSKLYIMILLGLNMFGAGMAKYQELSVLAIFYAVSGGLYAILVMYIIRCEFRWKEWEREDRNLELSFFGFGPTITLPGMVSSFVTLFVAFVPGSATITEWFTGTTDVRPWLFNYVFMLWIPFPFLGLCEQAHMLRKHGAESLSGWRLFLDATVCALFTGFAINGGMGPQTLLSGFGTLAHTLVLGMFITKLKNK